MEAKESTPIVLLTLLIITTQSYAKVAWPPTGQGRHVDFVKFVNTRDPIWSFSLTSGIHPSPCKVDLYHNTTEKETFFRRYYLGDSSIHGGERPMHAQPIGVPPNLQWHDERLRGVFHTVQIADDHSKRSMYVYKADGGKKSGEKPEIEDPTPGPLPAPVPVESWFPGPDSHPAPGPLPGNFPGTLPGPIPSLPSRPNQRPFLSPKSIETIYAQSEDNKCAIVSVIPGGHTKEAREVQWELRIRDSAVETAADSCFNRLLGLLPQEQKSLFNQKPAELIQCFKTCENYAGCPKTHKK